VWRCKYPRNPACTQVAVDRAFDDAEACPHCGRALEQGKGALRLPEGTTLRRSTRTSIDPDTGRAKEGELYAHDGLPAGTQLTGLIHGRDAWLELPHTLRIGGRRTVSGAASYEVVPAPQDSPPALTENGTLVVRLISPAVFVDVAGLPRLEPDPALDLDGAEVAARWVRPVVWSGWHAASRLPKPAEICAEAGSTYLIRGDRDRLLQLAERITTEGLGLRRAEGFGFAEIVTQPWCVGLEPAEADRSADPAAGRLAQVRALGLEPPERRWLVSALRGIQVEQQRATTAVKDVLEDMLAQPTAAALSGRQRDAIHTLITELDPAQLRDLSTTVEAMP
jgi:CRISPR-associated protein Csx10